MTALRVLVVEDDELVWSIAAEAIRDAGLEVVEAESGDSAVKLFTTPDGLRALVTDVRMPVQ